MFELFNDTARRCVVFAQEEARLLDHNYIGTEHLLLGILREETGSGSRILSGLGIDRATVEPRILEAVGRGQHPPDSHIPFTPRAKKVLELSLRESKRRRDNFIGSEHLLLGLLREGDGVGAQVLRERGVDQAAVEAALGTVERDPAPETDPSERDPGAENDMVSMPREDFSKLMADLARLRDLLRHHGIDPDEPLPGGADSGDG